MISILIQNDSSVLKTMYGNNQLWNSFGRAAKQLNYFYEKQRFSVTDLYLYTDKELMR